ncbi:GLPGLI family protein [Elizabethkingia meningoseptica]|uniref:GLPGLI family protein n=2 Tax=Elizabethkingia meningoseptica TaxID=238 RepID=UPI003891F7B7
MSKFFILITTLLLYSSVYSQKQIHIKYLNVRSEIANVYEDLYTNGTDVISIQDGRIISTSPNNTKLKSKGHDIYFISKLNNESSGSRKFQFTASVGYNAEKVYFVNDNIPYVKWTIEENSKKKILGYECKKATAVFRGAKITAYFAPGIPYSVGPFKFFGLPGVILDIREDNKGYDIWKAIKVDLNSKADVNYNPEFPDYNNVDIKTYTELKDNDRKRFSETTNKNLPSGSHAESVPGRLGVEKVFEWEAEKANQ